MKECKYTFVQFIAATECQKFDVLEEHWLRWAEIFISEITNNKSHNGDCHKLPCPCYLCALERYLTDYYQFVFNEESYRRENEY